MKLTLQTQLLPERDHAAKLKATVERFNEAANWAAGVAFEHRCSNKVELQKIVYRDLRERFGLSSRWPSGASLRSARRTSGTRGSGPSSARTPQCPYDQRMMSFKGPDRVSLLTLEGRVVVAVIMGKYQAERFTNAKGQSDLVLAQGRQVVPAGDGGRARRQHPIPATDFIGIDLGIAKIATDSDWHRATLGQAGRGRSPQAQPPAEATGRKNTKGAKKKLKRIAGKEARFRKHENHCHQQRDRRDCQRHRTRYRR